MNYGNIKYISYLIVYYYLHQLKKACDKRVNLGNWSAIWKFLEKMITKFKIQFKKTQKYVYSTNTLKNIYCIKN